MNTSGIIVVLTVETGSGIYLITISIAPESICHFKIIARKTVALNLFPGEFTDMPRLIEFAIPTGCPENRFLFAHFLNSSIIFLYSTGCADRHGGVAWFPNKSD